MKVLALDRPVPNLAQHREIKDQYRGHPIDTMNPMYNEPLVSVYEFGISGISYYAKPNRATGKPLPDVSPEPLVRLSVAEKLEVAKGRLWKSEELTRHLGGRAELIVKDALRSQGLVSHLHDVVFPRILREKYPDWDDESLEEERGKLISKPSGDASSPAPHTTGGAVDIDLIREDGASVDFGHVLGSSDVSRTDYYEGRESTAEVAMNPFAKVVRRALYWSMTEQGFANHPYEFWHYSYGDQMWALFSQEPAAFYGAVEGSPDLS